MQPAQVKQNFKKVLLLIDWDNLFYSLFTDFGPEETLLEKRLTALLAWVKIKLGDLLGGHGFVMAPEHLSSYHQQFCEKNGLQVILCPKRQLKEPKRDPKSGKLITTEDTVDETIIWFAKMMFSNIDLGTLCLVSRDRDYIDLLKEAGKRGIKRALGMPSLTGLSRKKNLLPYIDKDPETSKLLLFRLYET